MFLTLTSESGRPAAWTSAAHGQTVVSVLLGFISDSHVSVLGFHEASLDSLNQCTKLTLSMPTSGS